MLDSPNSPTAPISLNPPIPLVLRKQVNWENLHFFQKSDVLYQLAATFCERFLPAFGDRTVEVDLRGNGQYGLSQRPR